MIPACPGSFLPIIVYDFPAPVYNVRQQTLRESEQFHRLHSDSVARHSVTNSQTWVPRQGFFFIHCELQWASRLDDTPLKRLLGTAITSLNSLPVSGNRELIYFQHQLQGLYVLYGILRSFTIYTFPYMWIAIDIYEYDQIKLVQTPSPFHFV